MKTPTIVRLLAFFVCLVFVISLFFPFLQASWDYDSTAYQLTDFVWSFKVIIMMHYEDPFRVEESQRNFWFAEHWHRMGVIDLNPSLSNWMEPLLIFTLEAQLLTIFFSIVSVFKIIPHLLLFATVSSVASIILIWFIGYALSPPTSSFYKAVRFELGFWLSLLAAALSLAALILFSKWLKRNN